MVAAALLGAACGDENATTGPTPTPPPVVAAVSVAPGTASILVGRDVVLTASVRDANDRPLERLVVWSTEHPTIASVSANGTVTGLAAGVATILAISEGKTGTAVVTVAPVPVHEVRLSADAEVVLPWNGSAQLGAWAVDGEGKILDGRTVTWQSSKPEVVTVSANGRLTARGSGIALVGASIEGKHAQVGVRVTPVPVARLEIEGSVEGIEVGESVFLTGTAVGENGAPVLRPVTWTSSNPAVATVQSNQPPLVAVTARAVGRVTITGSVEGISASMTVEVSPRPTHDLLYTEWTGSSHANIYRLGLSGAAGGPVRLNAGSVSRQPSPSPDGSRIVFSVSQTHPVTGGPQDDLYVVGVNGLGMRQLTSSQGMESQGRWSPDGGRIVFVGTDPWGRSELWFVNPDGSGLQRVMPQLPPGMSNLQAPAWSPDGTRLAFTATVNGKNKIWLVNVDGTNLRQLTTDDGYDLTPTWSPQGDRIAFSRWNTADPAMGEDIMIVPVATGVPQRIALPGHQRMPAWSPDGQFLALVMGGFPMVSPQHIYTMRVDGTGIRQRTFTQYGGIGPAWIRR